MKKTRNEKTNIEVERENAEHELKRKKRGFQDETHASEKLKRNYEKSSKDLDKIRTYYQKIDVSSWAGWLYKIYYEGLVKL